MPHDQSSAVLAQLRELRATLAGHTARFDRVEERVDRLDDQLREIRLLVGQVVAQALEQGGRGHLRLRNPDDTSAEGSVTCQKRLEDSPGDPLAERMSDIERRLTKVEARLGG